MAQGSDKCNCKLILDRLTLKSSTQYKLKVIFVMFGVLVDKCVCSSFDKNNSLGTALGALLPALLPVALGALLPPGAALPILLPAPLA